MSFPSFTPLYWCFGILGAVVGLVGAGLLLGAIRLLQDHWR